MFISKAAYNEMLDLINEQRKSIEVLKVQNAALNKAKYNLMAENNRLLLTLCSKSDNNIDFPNTVKGGKGANTTTIDTNANGNYSF